MTTQSTDATDATAKANRGGRARQVSSPLRAARLAVSTIFFANGFVVASWAARIPAVREQLGLSTSALGLALLATAVGSLLAMSQAGALAARVGSRPVIVVAGVCFCATLPLLALAPSLPLLAGALLLYGAGNGAMDVAMNTQGVAVERRYGRPIFTAFHALFSLGGLAGAFVGGLVAARGTTPLPHFLVAAVVMGGVVVVASQFLLPPSADAGGAGSAFAWPTRALLALGLVAFCIVLGEGAISDWSAIYLAGTAHTGPGLAAAGYAAFSLLMAAGRLTGDRLTLWLGPAALVRAGGLTAAAGLLLALLVPWAPLALLGFALVGAGFSVVFPIALSAAGRTPGMAPGNAIAAVAACGYFGFLVGPPVIGFAASALNLRLALGVVVLLSGLAALLAPTTGRAAAPDEGEEHAVPLD